MIIILGDLLEKLTDDTDSTHHNIDNPTEHITTEQPLNKGM